MTPQAEATAILTRLLEALARASGKTLNERSRADISRACELLSHAGAELDELLTDVSAAPRVSPAEAMIEAAERDPGYRQLKEARERR
jgi:hypothetical protein